MIVLKYFALYLGFINIIAIIICLTDKLKAKSGGWRISEKTLFTVSLIGGSIGMYVTMQIIRHKTKHKRFMIGLPIIIILQAALILWLCYLTSHTL